MSQYIGKTISLISVTDNRYVGLLENIDSEKGTVTLNEVRCFGTEGRKNWGPDEIYPNPTVYQSVKFNGNDVKDLNILEVSLDAVQPVLHPNMQGQQQPQQQPQQQERQNGEQSPNQEQVSVQNGSQPTIPAAVAGYGVYAPSEADIKAQEEKKFIKQNQTDHKDYHQQQGQQKEPSARRQTRKQHNNKSIEIPSNDFDFASNNAKFAKEAPEIANEHIVPQETPSAATPENPDTFYNKKSSFFDSISTSAETNTNMRWQEEKELNLDTFGQSSARPRFHGGRGRGGFRGRGGNRGNRGGNRGNRGGNRGNRGGNQSHFNKRNDDITFGPSSSNVEF